MMTQEAERLLEPFRQYLTVLAELHLDRKLHGKLDPSDIVQQTFLRLFGPGRGAQPSAPRSWQPGCERSWPARWPTPSSTTTATSVPSPSSDHSRPTWTAPPPASPPG